jgi:hypothetical protein
MRKRILLGALLLTFVFAFNALTASAYTQKAEVDWSPSVKSGVKWTWTITTVDADGATEWDWGFANNLTLTQGEKITVEWTAKPNGTLKLGMGGPIVYDGIKVTVGTTVLDQSADEKFFNFFTVPIFVNNTLGITESMNYLERAWFTTFLLPSSDYGGQDTWTIDVDNASTDNIGPYAKAGDVIAAAIHDQGGEFPDDFPDLGGDAPEAYIFDLAYDARTGICKSVTYPSAVVAPNEYALDGATYTANSSWAIVSGLDELVITLDDTLPSGGWSSPGFEAPVVITGLFAVAAFVVIRRRK